MPASPGNAEGSGEELEHTEGKRRQYALADSARGLGFVSVSVVMMVWATADRASLSAPAFKSKSWRCVAVGSARSSVWRFLAWHATVGSTKSSWVRRSPRCRLLRFRVRIRWCWRKFFAPRLDAGAGFLEVVFERGQPDDPAVPLEPGELVFGELADGCRCKETFARKPGGAVSSWSSVSTL